MEIKSKTEFSPKICESNYAGFDQIVALLKLHVDIKTIEPAPHQAAPFTMDIGYWPLVFFIAVFGGVFMLITWLN